MLQNSLKGSKKYFATLKWWNYYHYYYYYFLCSCIVLIVSSKMKKWKFWTTPLDNTTWIIFTDMIRTRLRSRPAEIETSLWFSWAEETDGRTMGVRSDGAAGRVPVTCWADTILTISVPHTGRTAVNKDQHKHNPQTVCVWNVFFFIFLFDCLML